MILCITSLPLFREDSTPLNAKQAKISLMAMIQDIPTEQLPYWMRQARRGWDWGLLLALLFGLAAAWPFILQPGLPRTNASENHVFMSADYSQSLREGRLYPRWSAHVFGGYGAPIPHYYPPGAPYAAAVIELFFTNNVVDAVRILYILSFCLAAITVYLLVQRRMNAAAGLFATVLYVLSPYVAHVAPHTEGNLPVVLALALTPALLWAVDRLLTVNQPQDWLLIALLTAGLLLTHVYAALTALALICILIGYHARLAGRSVPLLLPLTAITAGIVLAAFYWLPAVLEYDLVRWQARPLRRAAHLSLTNLFAPFQPVDLNALITQPQLTIGIPHLALALLAVGGMIFSRRNVFFPLLFLLAAAALILIGALALPQETWLLGFVALCLAIGSSTLATLRYKLPLPLQRIAFALLLVVVIMALRTVWLAPYWPDTFGRTEPVDQVLYEQQGSGIAVLPAYLPVPNTLPANLPANRFLISAYQSDNVSKIAPISTGAGIQISILEHTNHSDRFQARLDVPTRLSIFTAYFPGWQAFANNRPVALERNPLTGLIDLNAPAMNGELRVSFGSTIVRDAAWLLSALATLCCAVITWRRFRRPRRELDDTDLLTNEEARLAGLSLGCFVAAILIFALPSSPLNLHARPGYGLDNATAVRSRTASGLEAIAFRLNRQVFNPGDSLHLSLYWTTVLPLPDNHQVQVYLRQVGQQARWYRSPFYTPGDYPTSRWRRYSYVEDQYTIQLSDSVVPGNYEIVVEVFQCTAGCTARDQVTFFDARGGFQGVELVLPTLITIRR